MTISSFFAKLYDVPQGDLDDLMKRVGLFDRRKTLAEKLSTGMKQRMLLVRAIINKPQVLFLDEQLQAWIRQLLSLFMNLLRSCKQKGQPFS